MPNTANAALAVGVIAFGLVPLLHPWVKGEGGAVRSLWSVAVMATAALAVYYTLWTTTT